MPSMCRPARCRSAPAGGCSTAASPRGVHVQTRSSTEATGTRREALRRTVAAVPSPRSARPCPVPLRRLDQLLHLRQKRVDQLRTGIPAEGVTAPVSQLDIAGDRFRVAPGELARRVRTPRQVVRGSYASKISMICLSDLVTISPVTDGSRSATRANPTGEIRFISS